MFDNKTEWYGKWNDLKAKFQNFQMHCPISPNCMKNAKKFVQLLLNDTSQLIAKACNKNDDDKNNDNHHNNMSLLQQQLQKEQHQYQHYNTTTTSTTKTTRTMTTITTTATTTISTLSQQQEQEQPPITVALHHIQRHLRKF
jgi:predicted peptidase